MIREADARESRRVAIDSSVPTFRGLDFSSDVSSDGEAAAGAGFATATDLADWLVREKGLAFRDAHHVTGALVALAETKDCALHELTLSDMQSVNDEIDEGIYSVLSVENSVASRMSYGGTAPEQVRFQIKRWKEILEQ